jgi:hypothetical protein
MAVRSALQTPEVPVAARDVRDMCLGDFGVVIERQNVRRSGQIVIAASVENPLRLFMAIFLVTVASTC